MAEEGRVVQMNYEPCCETCRWCEAGESGKLYCENKNADEWYEEVTWHHRCPLWEERDE